MRNEKYYQSYLIRLQRGQGQAHWRTILQNVHTGEILRFATEQECLQYLVCQLRIKSSVSTDDWQIK